MAKDLTDELLDEAFKLQEEASNLLERTRVNRNALRSLLESGKINEDQASLINEIYPIVKRPRKKGQHFSLSPIAE